MDAAVRELAPIGTLARDRRFATAVAVAVSLVALGAARGGSSPGSWPWAIAGLGLLAASTFVLVGVHRSAEDDGRVVGLERPRRCRRARDRPLLELVPAGGDRLGEDTRANFVAVHDRKHLHIAHLIELRVRGHR